MQSKKKMHEEHEFNDTMEIEKLYYKLSASKDRSKLCFLLYLIIIPLFIIIGGVTFSLSELVASQEAKRGNTQVCVAERKILMENLKASLENNSSTKSYTSQNLTNIWQSIQDTVIEIESCHRKRLFELMPIETFVFRNALLYSFSVYTTIGYGNLFPRTVKGRILTLVYAVIGIPLNVAFVADLGELIARTVQCALRYFQQHILNKTTEDPYIECKKFSLMILIAILFTPTFAVIVMEVERSRNWNYFDSLYYTFTTSTLIGFGDLTPQSSAWFCYNTKSDLKKSSTTVGTNSASVDAKIAKLSAREMLIDEKINKEMQMLEAIPSEINLGILNAQMKSNDESNRRLKHTLKRLLHEH
ncbi:Open rectifier potassium channel protein [Dirofilaria immitis]